MTRFPELHQSLPSEPISHGFVEGIVMVVAYCAFMYLLPLLGVVSLIRDRLLHAQRLGALGVALCLIAPMTWILYNPLGVWFVLIPIVAPAAFASYLLYINAKRRLYHRRNPTNLLAFRPRDTLGAKKRT